MLVRRRRLASAHQSEHAFMSFSMPVLYPATVQEYIDYALLGWAMSRYSGLWVGFKCVNETVESTATVDVDPDAAAGLRRAAGREESTVTPPGPWPVISGNAGTPVRRSQCIKNGAPIQETATRQKN